MKRYPHIFKPFRCKNLELKNRIVMMPMGTNYGEQTHIRGGGNTRRRR